MTSSKLDLNVAAAITILQVTLTLMVVSATPGPSPCRYERDNVYGGVLVDCKGQGLSAVPPADWLPADTTSLLLQLNYISNLTADSFVKVSKLRLLSLAFNQLESSLIDPNAFRGLKDLHTLDLEHNVMYLNRENFKMPLFKELNNLVELNLMYNNNKNVKATSPSYPPNLLTGLISLQTLGLDTFPGGLYFSDIFKQTRKLNTLTLTGGMSAIRNDSFHGFEEILEFKRLYLSHTDGFKLTENGGLQHLKHVTTYSINSATQGMTPTLESLAPFVGRNFTLLSFNKIEPSNADVGPFRRDSVLTSHVSRYLSQICVKHFVYTDNRLFYVEEGVLTNTLWANCLVSLDLSDNPIQGDRNALIYAIRLRHLQSVRVMNQKYSIFDMENRVRLDTMPRSKRTPLLDFNDNGTRSLYISNDSVVNVFQEETKMEKRHQSTLSQKENVEINQLDARFNGKNLGTMTIYLPPTLTYANLAGSSRNNHLYLSAHVIGGHNLKEVNVADFGLSYFVISVTGVENVEVADISKNDGSVISPSFFNQFPKIIRLNMADMRLRNVFTQTEHRIMFHALSRLETLDLSKNDLFTLPSGIFAHNDNLKYLSLAGNRFKSIPFNIKQTPILQTLDLRDNILTELSSDEISELEHHASTSPLFHLQLNGNMFACGCSNIKFLRWLQVTTVDLDNHRNYSCISQNGTITTTGEMRNVVGLWRTCVGKDAFLISLIFLCLIALGFSIVTIVIKFKTQISAAIFQYFSKTFAPKTHRDYQIGVYVGYSSQDANFACFKLRSFIEDQLHLTTFIRDRDLLPASDMADSIVTYINSSWRILLVVTDTFLDDPWSYLAMKTAMYSVDASNPGRVVLVILDGRIRHRIPSYVLTAVREESIIEVTEHDLFTESQKQALHTALLS